MEYYDRVCTKQTVTEKIQQRRYQMLVHSYLYYQLGENLISDYDFDYWAKELVDLQEQYPEESKKARYYEEFKDFDGSSGFDLPYSMPNIQKIGNNLLEYKKNFTQEWMTRLNQNGGLKL